ncbi:reverse transcriptase domain-containing protein [Tanacetum coccineum]
MRADRLPPRKRFRGPLASSSHEGSIEDSFEASTESDILADIKADIAAEAAAAFEAEVRAEAEDEVETKDEVDRDDKVEDDVKSSGGDTIEIRVDVVVEPVAPNDLPGQTVAERLEEYEETMKVTVDTERARLLDKEELKQIRVSHYYDREDFRRLETFVMRPMTITRSGMTPEAIKELINRRVTEALAEKEANRNHGPIAEGEIKNGDDNRNGNGGGNRNGNSGGNGNGGVAPVARVCTYKDFLNCQPRNFSRTEGVVGLTWWFEKIESVFCISNCTEDSQVKFSTCTFLDGALTWWNSHVKTIGIDEAYRISWKELMKLMIEVYCLRNEIQKLENELWSLSVKGTNDAIKMANSLMDQRVRTYAAKNAENKRMFENQPQDNRVQQPPYNRQNVPRAYTACTNKKKAYARTLSYYNKCKMHHSGQCTAKCGNCKRGHYRNECFKLKGQGCGNQVANTEAQGRAFALGGGENNKDSNVVMGYPFNIDLMLVELGSFDVIIGIDWLSKYHTVIIYDEKVVWIPYGDEVLTIQGDGSNGASNSKLSIISCTKTQKYIQKGCYVFLAQITEKKAKDKSEEKRLEDVSIIRDFP